MTKFLNISTDTTLGGSTPSDDVVSSQKALKTYIDSQTGTAPAFANIVGQPSDNANLATALNAKYDASNPNGYTSNVGTVTSVNNTSPDGNGNVTLVIPDSLPSQTGHSGEYLTTDGTDPSWAAVDALPSQTGQSGKFLTTDGTDASWATVGALPSQTGQSGKFLTTDGMDASWAAVDALPSQTGHSGDLLTTDGTDASWVATDTIYPVVETYSSGSDWYRIYSDGWVEQGGITSLTTGTTTVNLLVEFADTNYNVTTGFNVNNATAQYGYMRQTPTVSSIIFKGTGNVNKLFWRACGYGA